MTLIDEIFDEKNVEKALRPIRKENQEKWMEEEKKIKELVLKKAYIPTIQKFKRHESYDSIARILIRLLKNTILKDCISLLSGNYYTNTEQALNDMLKEANQGKIYYAEIVHKNIVETMLLDDLKEELERHISNDCVLSLLENLLYTPNKRKLKRKQGLLESAMTSELSLIYCFPLYEFMTENWMHWFVYQKKLYLFANSEEHLHALLKKVFSFIQKNYPFKSSYTMYEIYSATPFGYEFYLEDETLKYRLQGSLEKDCYKDWHADSIHRIHKEFHLVQEGTLNKKDFSLLFENESQKQYIPAEVTSQLNVYTDVTINQGAVSLCAKKGIRIAFMDSFGDVQGWFIPAQTNQKAVYKQFEKYFDQNTRIKVAKKLEKAFLHNLKANIRSYKRSYPELKEKEDEINAYIKQFNFCQNIQQLMLVEAKAREAYYASFNVILNDPDFIYTKRSKQPPKDPLNALISFGNTLLYNRILQMLWKSTLDPKVGVIHSSQTRAYSLHLDFADLFKPIIVDRVIFSLINKKQIRIEHFEKYGGDGVYLTDQGKKIFIKAFEAKMNQKQVKEDIELSYQQLIQNEIHHYQDFIQYDQVYKPYKYN